MASPRRGRGHFVLAMLTLLFLPVVGQSQQCRARIDYLAPKVPPTNRLRDIVLDTGFQTIDGRKLSIGGFRGKVLIVNVWATWCGPCRKEIPHILQLQREYGSQGVEVVGLTTEHPVSEIARVRQFVSDLGIGYPIGFLSGQFGAHLMQAKGVIPQTYVLGRDSRVIRYCVGFDQKTGPIQLRNAIEEALEEPVRR